MCIDGSPCDCAPHVCEGQDIVSVEEDEYEEERGQTYIRYGNYMFNRNNDLTGYRGLDVDLGFTVDPFRFEKKQTAA